MTYTTGNINYKNKNIHLTLNAEPQFQLFKLTQIEKQIQNNDFSNISLKDNPLINAKIQYNIYEENNELLFNYIDKRNNYIATFSLTEISKILKENIEEKLNIEDIIYDCDKDDAEIFNQSFQELKENSEYAIDDDSIYWYKVFRRIYRKISFNNETYINEAAL